MDFFFFFFQMEILIFLFKAEQKNKELEEEINELRSGTTVSNLPIEADAQPASGFSRKSVFKSTSKG